jgi:ABC-type multidrug transport system fused ATPase/permease subunit
MFLQKKLLALAWRVRWQMAWVVFLGLAATATRVGQAVVLAYAVVAVLHGAGLVQIVTPLGWLAALIASRALLRWGSALAAQHTAGRVKERVREAFYRRLLKLGPGYLSAHRTGEIRSVIVDGAESLESYYAKYLPAVLQAILAPVAIVLYLATISPLLCVVALAGVLVALFAPQLWNKMNAKGSAEVFVALGRMDADFVDTIQGLPTLKAFDATRRRRSYLAEQAEEVRRVCMAQLRVSLANGAFQRLGTVGGVAAVLILGAFAVAGGGLSAVSLLIVLFVVPELFRPLDELGESVHDALGAIGAIDGIDALLHAPDVTPDPPRSADTPPVVIEPTIEFDSVSLRYPGREVYAISDVSFTVGAGQQVALVGPSGAGKSTLSSLLLRFLDPTSGAVRIGGRDLRSLTRTEIWEHVSLVAQDTYLFNGTVADNIALGKPGADRAEVRAAAESAGVADFIDELSDGFDTQVGERGAQLSGGQRQRIAIARAVLKDAPILVLDEATSSVDAANESAIQSVLRTIMRNGTTLVIAHRLSTVRDVDRILVLSDGQLVEYGDHDELFARQGVYTKLVSVQGGDR